MPDGIFSQSGMTPVIFIGKDKAEAARIVATVTAAPAIDALYSAMPSGCFKHKPPLK